MASVGHVAGAVDNGEGPAGQLGEALGPGERLALVMGAVDDADDFVA